MRIKKALALHRQSVEYLSPFRSQLLLARALLHSELEDPRFFLRKNGTSDAFCNFQYILTFQINIIPSFVRPTAIGEIRLNLEVVWIIELLKGHTLWISFEIILTGGYRERMKSKHLYERKGTAWKDVDTKHFSLS